MSRSTMYAGTRRLVIGSLAVLAVAGGTACAGSSAEAPGTRLRLSSDSAEYTRADSGDALVRLTLANGGDGPVTLTGCPRPPSAYLVSNEFVVRGM